MVASIILKTSLDSRFAEQGANFRQSAKIFMKLLAT